MEIWKTANGYRSRYLVSSLGRIMGLTQRQPRILRPATDKRGYHRVLLVNKDGVRKFERVHRLVAIAFLDNLEKYPNVNHKDMNPLNNNLENIEWCSQSYNVKHAEGIIGKWQRRGSKSGKSKLNEKQVLKIVSRLKREDAKSIAMDYEVCPATINSIKIGNTWSWLTGIGQ